MKVRTVMEGTSPLLCHNVRLANPFDPQVKLIQAITSKRTKTDEDRMEIARLEWFGSLYVHEGRVVIPTFNVRKCLIEAGKVNKQGKAVGRAAAPIANYATLAYHGPEDIGQLWEREEFRDMTVVGVGQQRTPRCRPRFMPWGLVIDWELITDALDLDTFERTTVLAGRIEGLGDNRVNGYGKFNVQIEIL